MEGQGGEGEKEGVGPGLSKLVSGNFCDIDLRDKFGRTPLMYAVLGNFPSCVEVGQQQQQRQQQRQ